MALAFAILLSMMGATALYQLFITYHVRRKAPLAIGILQSGTHSTLTTVRETFKQELSRMLGMPITFVERNAQGDITRAHAAAEHMHSDASLSLFLTIGTLASQAMASVEKKRPIIIAAVSYPETFFSSANRNITGISDLVPMQDEIAAVKALLPGIHSVGIVYNPAEANAVKEMHEMANELERVGITYTKIGVTHETEVATAASVGLSKVDALIVPTDNTIASAMPALIKLCKKASKPLIVCYNDPVHYGALMARGVDYHDNGYQAAHIAAEIILYAQEPHTMPIRKPRSGKITVNAQTLADLDLIIPESIASQVVLVDSVSCALPQEGPS
jgi:putative ABC transport system substrate-binding protein